MPAVADMGFDSDIPLESEATDQSEGSFGAADDAALSGTVSDEAEYDEHQEVYLATRTMMMQLQWVKLRS